MHVIRESKPSAGSFEQNSEHYPLLTTLTKFILDIYIEMIISISKSRNYRIFTKRKEKKKFSLCKLVNLIRVKLKSTLFFRTSAITRARRGRERERERRRSRRGGRRIKRINNRSDLYAGDHGRQASGGEGVQRPEPHNRRPQSKRQLGDSWSKAQG